MVFVTSVLAEAKNPMIAPPYVFGVVALALFLVLAVVLWSYRDIAHRQRRHTPSPDAASHAGAPGAASHSSGQH